MTNALAVQAPISDQLQQAEFFLRSGFMPKHFDTTAKVYAAITLGQELGLAPWAALNNIFVIGGKPSINANLMLSLIQSSGLLTDFDIDANDQRAIVRFGRRSVGVYTSTFTMEDAKRAGLTTGTNSRMWSNYPKAMLKARAIADCARTLFADVLLGMYTPEEIGAEVSGIAPDGSLIIIPPVALTKDEGRRLAEKWLAQGLTGADLRAALGGGYDQWTQGYEAADARIAEWLKDQHQEAEAEAQGHNDAQDEAESEDRAAMDADADADEEYQAALDRDPD